MAARLAPGVREDPRLVRESVESTRYGAMNARPGSAMSTSSAGGGHGAGGGGAQYTLEPITWEGRPYLLDRRTGAVYADNGAADAYPELVGRWQDGRLVLRSRNVVVDMFAGLDRYLRENKVRFKDLFDSFDADRSGTLEIRELAQLVKQLVSGVTVPELKYIMAMLDSSGDGRVTQEEFLAAAKASLDAAKRLQAARAAGAAGGGAAAADVRSVLNRVTDYLRANQVDARAVFDRFDADRNGRLDPGELARFFMAALPGVDDSQLRYLMAHMYELDANGDGTVSYPELLYALRAADVQRAAPAGGAPAASPPVLSRSMSAAAQPGGTEWVLEDVFDPNTQTYLKRDPATGLVYREVVAGEWPQVVGLQDAGGVLRLVQRKEDGGLFAALDAYLRSNKVKFRDMFDHFDADRSGYLDMAELRELVRAILPGFTEGQLLYFQALLDINGDGSISFDEMMAVAKECLAAERAAAASGGARDPTVKAALDRFQAYLVQYSTAAAQHFEAADATHRGFLKFPEFARFLQRLMPDLQESQRRAILSYLNAQDIEESGSISWLMLARYMRVPHLSQLAGQGARTPPGAQAPPPGLRRAATSARQVTFENDQWELQVVQWRNANYLMDPHTKRVYKEGQPGEWPTLVGVYRDGEVVLQERSMAVALFETLDAYLKEQRLRCREVFNHFDGGAKGWLAPEELGRLVEHFLPGQVSAGDVKYFQVMVDRNHDGQITYEEFLEAARTCKAEETAARQRTADARAALQMVSDYIRQSNAEMRSAFQRFDANRNGLLEPRELAQMLRTALPSLTPEQLRMVLAHLHQYDLDGDGALSFREFTIAMRAVDARKQLAGGQADVVPGSFTRSPSFGGGRLSPAVGAQSPPPSRGRPSDGVDWDNTEWNLQEFVYNGQVLLLDQRTQRVYVSPDGRSWPQLLGKLTNGRVTRTSEIRPNDLWTRLDAYLRSNKVKLQELFSAYDTSRQGSLRPKELARLIRDIMPDVTRAELHYFLAMMDANGDGAVSYDEFLTAARDSLRAAQQLAGAGSGGGGASAFPPEVLRVLEELSTRLGEQPGLAKRMFNQADANGNGSLDLSEASRFLRSLLPELGARQLQYVLSYLAALDLDGDGTLTFSELMTGLHALQARGPNGVTYDRGFTGAAAAAPPPSSASPPVAANRATHQAANASLLRSTSVNRHAYTQDWELHEWRYRGTVYLLDPVTNLVYSDVASANEWPELLGRKVGEQLQRLDGSATITFFKNLDAYLKAEQVKFAALFSEFDRGRKGYLERGELAGLVRRVMPEATDAQIRFLATVLDENNDKVFTQQELLGAARKVVELLRQQQAGGGAGAPAPEVAAVLDRISRFLVENMDRARAYFEQLDPQRRGYLDYDGVAAFFRGLAPRLAHEELRFLLARVHLYDVDGEGQVTFAELLRAMRAAELRSTRGKHVRGWGARGGAVGGAGPVYDAPSTWRLEPYRWGDRDVLLDPQTQVLYSRPTSDVDWPQPVGRLATAASGRTVVAGVQSDTYQFFKRLDTYLKENRLRLRQLFDAADADRSGALDSREMARLIKHIMPEAGRPQLNYFIAMLDLDGSNRLTYEQFVEVCRQCVEVEAATTSDLSSAAGGGFTPEMAAALRRLSTAITRDKAAAVQLFRAADRDGSGRLEPREVAVLLRRLVPETRPEDLRTAVAVMFRNMDHDGDGTLSFQEFMYALRAVDLQTPDRTLRAGSWQVARAGAYPASRAVAAAPAAREPLLQTLDLEEVVVLRQRYLWSRATNVVYEWMPPQGSGQSVPAWPKALGLLDRDRGAVQQAGGRTSSADLFTALDSYLRTAKVRFSDLFARYDTDRSGLLEPRELGRLVSDLLAPSGTAVTAADVAYFVAMLDLDGSRGVSEQEFLSVAKEYLQLERRATDLGSAAAEEVRRSLERVSQYLQADKEAAYELFRARDTKGTGRITLAGLVPFFTDLLRNKVAQRQLHYVITHLHGCDVGKVGTFSFNELLVGLRAVPVRYPGGMLPPGFNAPAVAPGAAAAAAGYGGAPRGPVPSLAQLEAFVHGGRTYYRDPDTGLVYVLVDDRRLGPRLELARLRTAPGRGARDVLGGAGGAGRPNPAERLFDALDAVLKENRIRLRDVFDRYDYNRNGRLEARELARLVRDLLPGATEADFNYLLAMLDYDGDVAVSYDELVAAVRECWAAGRAVSGRGEGGSIVEAVLGRVASFLRSQRESARDVFYRFDRNGNGRLEARELARFLKAAMPELSPSDVRHVVSHLHSLDTNGDGALSYNELLHALHAVELQLPDGRRMAARYVARTPGTAAAGYRTASAYGSGAVRPYAEVREWRLEAWQAPSEGRELWLDRDTGMVYQPAGSKEEGWPALLGARTADGSVYRLESTLSARFFAALDRKLRVERLRLDELLGSYDRDGNAGLDEQELGRLARSLLNEDLTAQSIKYLMAILDLDGDRLVSRGEVVEVFQQLGSMGSRITGLQDPRMVDLLNRMSSAVSRNLRTAWERFCRADVNGTGALEPGELKWFLSGLLPNSTPEDVRLLLTYLHLLDVNGNGRIEFKELLVALRALPVRTPSGLMRPPTPPFRVRRDIPTPPDERDRDRGQGRQSYSGGRGYDDDGAQQYDEYGRRVRRGYGSEEDRDDRRYGGRRPSSGDDQDASYRNPATSIPDREFVMELRPVRSSSARRSSDGRYGSGRSSGSAAASLRDPDSGLLYAPADSGDRATWPQLVAYEDPRDGGRRCPLPPLAEWSLLLDLEAHVQRDPGRLEDAARRRAAGARGGSGANDTLDVRTASSLLSKLALEAAGYGGGGSSRDRPDEPWVELLLRGMMGVMHDRGVRVRKLQRDVEALAGAYRLLTDPRDGPALLRDAATALNREYRQVVRAMRKRVQPGGAGPERDRDRDSRSSYSGGEGVLRLADVRDVLQDTIPDALSGTDAAMAVLLYLLYNVPHCLARGSPLTLGWKDVFKALRAVRCRHPDGTSRVGHWDAQELARADDRASEDGSRSHSSLSDGGGAGGRRHGRRSAASSGRHHRDRDRDRPRRGEYDYEQDYEYGGRGAHRSRSRGPHGYDPEYRRSSPGGYGPGGYDAWARRRSLAGGAATILPPYDGMDPEEAAMLAAAAAGGNAYEYGSSAAAAPGPDPRLMALQQRALGRSSTYTYRSAVEDPAVQAVRQRMASDLRISRDLAASGKRLNLSLRELSRRKVHPERRVVNLELYNAKDGKQYGLDSATGLVYNLSQSEDYPELAGKVRPGSGELALGGGASSSLHGVFSALRTLDEAALVQLFKAYDTNNNGTLELKELMALLRDVAGLPYAEAGLVQALLDVDLSNTLTLKEWVEGIRASTDTLDAAAAAFGTFGGVTAGGGGGAGASRAQRAALTVLAAVSAQIAADLEVFWAAYARADRDGNGYLDVAELARFFKDLFRDMPPYDLRLLVAHAFTADMEKDGLVRPDELLQHLRAIPLKSPSGVLHRPGFRVPSAAPGRSGLLDSIPSSKSNARFSYARSLSGLTIDVPEHGSESLAAKLPMGHAFLGSPHGAASVLSMAAPATPHGAAPMAAMPNMTGGMAMPYVPVPVPMPMPYMMPGAGPSVPGAPGGSVMGYLLPYQQDMYQALYDRLTSSGGGRHSSRYTTPRASEAGVRNPSDGSVTPLSSDVEDDGPPPPPVSAPYVEQPPPPYPDVPPPPPSVRSSGSYPQRRRSSRLSSGGSGYRDYYNRGSRSYSHVPQYGSAPYPQQPMYDNSAPFPQPPPYDPMLQQQQPPLPGQGYAQPPLGGVGPGGSGFGSLIELYRAMSASPQAFRNAFMALARKSPATAAGAARRTSYSGSPYNTRTAGGYVYVVPRGTLGQLVSRLCPNFRDADIRYTTEMLTATLPYNTASYTEEDLQYAARQGAGVERSWADRRPPPPDVAAAAAQLADDVNGNAAHFRGAFRDADRYRRGSLPLPEHMRIITRLSNIAPHVVQWLTAGIAQYMSTVLHGATDMTYAELGAALSHIASYSGTGAPMPYSPTGAGAYPGAQPQYDAYGQPVVQQQQYDPRYPMNGPPSPSGMGPGASFPDPLYPGAQGPYPQSPNAYGAANALPSPFASNAPYPNMPGTGGHPYPTYGQVPPQPYSGQPPYPGSPYGQQPGPYGGQQPPHAGAGMAPIGYNGQQPPYSPYGSPPGSPTPGGYGAPYGGAVPYPGDPLTPTASSPGAAYYMWTQANRQAVLEKHMSSVLKGRVGELEVHKAALDREAHLQGKIMDMALALQQHEAAKQGVLALLQSYRDGGAPPVSVQEMLDRISATLRDAIEVARTGAKLGPAALPGAAPPADFDSLLEALTSARWVSGQPVSADTLRAAVALRRDAFALRRAHQAALVEAEGKKTSLAIASAEAQQAMTIQMQLLQGHMQRQAQELQQRLLLEAQAVAAAAAAAAAGQPGSAAAAAAAAALNPQFAPGGLPGLFLPQHGQLGTGMGTAAIAGLGAATAAAQQQLGTMAGGLGPGSLVPLGAWVGGGGAGLGLGLATGPGLGGVNGGGSPGATGVLVPISGVTASAADPRMVLSPRTWQLEPVGGSGVVNGLAGSQGGSPGRGVYGRGASVGGAAAAAALYPAPARD